VCLFVTIVATYAIFATFLCVYCLSLYYNFVLLYGDDALMCIYFSTRFNCVTLFYLICFRENMVHFSSSDGRKAHLLVSCMCGKGVTSVTHQQSSWWWLPVDWLFAFSLVLNVKPNAETSMSHPPTTSCWVALFSCLWLSTVHCIETGSTPFIY
jgi:hypothetical protein